MVSIKPMCLHVPAYDIHMSMDIDTILLKNQLSPSDNQVVHATSCMINYCIFAIGSELRSLSKEKGDIL